MEYVCRGHQTPTGYVCFGPYCVIYSSRYYLLGEKRKAKEITYSLVSRIVGSYKRDRLFLRIAISYGKYVCQYLF